MFGRATIRLGIGPHSSFAVFFVGRVDQPLKGSLRWLLKS